MDKLPANDNERWQMVNWMGCEVCETESTKVSFSS